MKLISLDLDGTLEDSRDDMVAAAQRVRAEFGLPERVPTQLRPFVNAGMDTLYRACFDDYLTLHGDAAIANVRRAYEADYLQNVAVATTLYPGIADALQALAKLGTLACVTNKPEQISRRLLDALGVGALFHTVIGGDSCSHPKPHRVMLEAAANSCSFNPTHDQAFMIGDTPGDLKLAKAFGATGIWCSWGYDPHLPRSSDPPDLIAHHPSDLPGLIAH